MPGWGQPHAPAPSPVATTGTSREIDDALAALRTVGIDEPNLARAALAAAGTIDRIRHGLVLELAMVAGGTSAIADQVRRHVHELLGSEVVP